MLVKNVIGSKKLVTIGMDLSIFHAVKLFREFHLDALPVLDKLGELVGIVTRHNLYDAMLARVDLEQPVSTIMVTNLIVVKEDFSLDGMISDKGVLLLNSAIGQAVVMDNENKPIGLLNKETVIRYLLDRANLLASYLGSVVDAMEYGVVTIDKDGTVKVFNSTAAELTGLKPEKVIGQPAASVMQKLGLSQALAENRQLKRQRFKIKENIILVNCHPVPGQDKPLGAVAILQDMTKLEQISGDLESVKKLNNTLDTILEIAYDGIIVVDVHGSINMVNRSMCNFLGKSDSEIIGCHVTDIMENTRLHIVARTGVAEYSDVQVIGGTRYIVSRLPIIKDGRPAGAVGKMIFHNLGELKERVKKLELLEREVSNYRDGMNRQSGARYTFDHIVSMSPEIELAKKQAQRAAMSELPVLLLGPSGTGKELFAHSIHNAGPRRSSALIKVNCAAIPYELLESEFFGYEAGAFTGAGKQGKPGKFELADGGTLFLDEIGDMSPNLQVKLLRVLQDGEVERIGGRYPHRVDVRVIAATNQNLEGMVKTGRFRADLYFRLNVIPIKIPSLAQSRENIPALVQTFINKFNPEMGKRVLKVTPEALDILMSYSWPGNIRELENIIRRTMFLLDGDIIDVQHLPDYLGSQSEGGPLESAEENIQLSPVKRVYNNKIASRERELIIEALATAGGSRKRAAEILGIGRATLYEKMNRLGLPTSKKKVNPNNKAVNDV